MAALIRVIASEGHSEIGMLYYEFGVEHRDAGGNRLDRARHLVQGIPEVYEAEDAERTLVELTDRILKSASEWALQRNDEILQLLESLALDGYQFRDGHLEPTTPAPARLGPQISEVEQLLEAAALRTAFRHYQQAVDNFTRRNFEASNGQIRSFAEDLFIGLAAKHGKREFDDASAALQHLRDIGWLDLGEWNFLRGYWTAIQERGPHRGLSGEEEALLRLHAGTSLCRYLLKKM